MPRSGPLSLRTQVRKLGTLCYELQSLLDALGELREELSLAALGRLLAGRELPADVRRLIETRLSFVRPHLACGATGRCASSGPR